MIAANLRYDPKMSKSLPPLQKRLLDAAQGYLARYEASVQSLRRVLKRRVERWSRAEGQAQEGAAAAIEAVIALLVGRGAVDDARYAASKTLSLFRGGRSARAIRAALASRGIAPELAEAALAGRCNEALHPEEPDIDAALRWAQKRRLGRFRPPAQRLAKRDRDLAALGRAGFSWEIARAVVDET
jgi:regulatory protein